MDADSHPSVELFADVAAAIADGHSLAGGSTVAFADGALMPTLAVETWNAISRVTRWAAGSFIFCEASTFRAIGGFSQELYAAEEIDLFRRLKRVARKTHRTIRILHRHPIVTSDRKARLYAWPSCCSLRCGRSWGAGGRCGALTPATPGTTGGAEFGRR